MDVNKYNWNMLCYTSIREIQHVVSKNKKLAPIELERSIEYYEHEALIFLSQALAALNEK